MEPSWGRLGASWAVLGPSWSRLGAVLGRLGGVLGRLGGVLGRLVGLLGSLGSFWNRCSSSTTGAKAKNIIIFVEIEIWRCGASISKPKSLKKRSWMVFEASWAILKASWRRLGASWSPFAGSWGCLGRPGSLLVASWAVKATSYAEGGGGMRAPWAAHRFADPLILKENSKTTL